MTWNAMARTKTARLSLVLTHLQAEIAEAGLPSLADDPLGESGKAVYRSPITAYPSPCVEILGAEGPVDAESENQGTTVLEGWIVLSYRSTDSAVPLADLADGYLTALVRAAIRTRSARAPDEDFEVVGVSTSPSDKQGDGAFAQGVGLRLRHTIIEQL